MMRFCSEVTSPTTSCMDPNTICFPGGVSTERSGVLVALAFVLVPELELEPAVCDGFVIVRVGEELMDSPLLEILRFTCSLIHTMVCNMPESD